MGVVGKVIAGGFGKLIVRQKEGENIELGELLIGEAPGQKLLLQVYDLVYGSQLSQQSLEMVSGLSLEGAGLEITDFGSRNYTLALLKGVLAIVEGKNQTAIPKSLPLFFSDVRRVEPFDVSFLSATSDALFLGNLRSGSKLLPIPIGIDCSTAITHHILISAQTGKGKSNLTKVMLFKSLDSGVAGFLVLDPHDEYFGRHALGLRHHPSAKEKLVYYTPNEPPPGCRSLVLNLELLRPEHFEGVLFLSDAQWQAVSAFYRTYKEKWIEAVVLEKEIKQGFLDATVNVVRRRLMQTLELSYEEGRIVCEGIFSQSAGLSTVEDICRELESGKCVVVDTSAFSKSQEVLVGSVISTELLRRYRYYKHAGTLKNKPAVGIVIEEAPRVLGNEALERGGNIFSTIAREGRKFKLGLLAITQLPSLIPREILANINTKIILGTEMANERQALINSAAQDLSEDNRTIASLDTGEAIVSSSFLKMAVPIKVPRLEDLAGLEKNTTLKPTFTGVKMN